MTSRRLIAALQAEAAGLEARLAEIRTTLAVLGRLAGVRATGTPAAAKDARRKPLAAGALPARVLEIVGEVPEGVKFQTIVAAAKAKAYQVRAALDALRADRRLVREGSGRTTLYRAAKP